MRPARMVVLRGLERMRTDTTSAASAIFAANRASGAVSFDVHQVDGVTRRRHLHESGSLRVRFPSPEARRPVGGVRQHRRRHRRRRPFRHRHRSRRGLAADGDDGGGGKSLSRARAGRAAQHRAEGRGGAHLAWLPQETILFDRARVSRADRHRSGRRRLAAALRNRGVRPRRDGRADAAAASSSTAGGCAAAAGWCSPKPSGSTATSAQSSRGRRSPRAASPSARR